MPTIAAGMLAMQTLNQVCQTARFSSVVLFRENGQSLFQNKTTTAIIAPICITTSNIDINSDTKSGWTSFPTVRGKNSSNKIICPVELTGSHSVMPSIIPKKIALISSKTNILFLSANSFKVFVIGRNHLESFKECVGRHGWWQPKLLC